jgi:predicted Zn finger-like uncharacterized protein
MQPSACTVAFCVASQVKIPLQTVSHGVESPFCHCHCIHWPISLLHEADSTVSHPMPEQIKCPSCGTKLRLPETLLGKIVKCPKCQTSFTAAVDEPADPEGIVSDPVPPARKRPLAREEPEDEEAVQDDDEAYESREDNADESPRRRRRRKRSRSRDRYYEEALSAVSAPSICLIVFSVLSIAVNLVQIILRLVEMKMGAVPAPGPQGQQFAQGYVIGTIIGLAFNSIGIFLQPVVIFGAIRMRQLRSYGLAMTASILAMLPCGLCCLLGLPFGIWSLVVINRPDVRDSFS